MAAVVAMDVELCDGAVPHIQAVQPYLLWQSDRIYNKRLLAHRGTCFVHFHPFFFNGGKIYVLCRELILKK